jgi:hypothetical protein
LFQVHLSISTASKTVKGATMTMAIEVNCETGQVTERPLTVEEIAANEAAAATAEAERVAAEEEAQTKAVQRQAILDRLGLTADEAALLLGAN